MAEATVSSEQKADRPRSAKRELAAYFFSSRCHLADIGWIAWKCGSNTHFDFNDRKVRFYRNACKSKRHSETGSDQIYS